MSIFKCIDLLLFTYAKHNRRTASVSISNCDFQSIITTTSIIDDELRQASNIYIGNTNIDIISGSIYYSKHVFETNINIYNISITSTQLNSDNDVGLFYFSDIDVTNITKMKILYQYDTTVSCNYYESVSNSVIGATCDIFNCSNPVMLIQNHGKVYRVYFFDNIVQCASYKIGLFFFE